MVLLVIVKAIITENCSGMEKSIYSDQNSEQCLLKLAKKKLFHHNSKPCILSVKASVLIKVLLYPALRELGQKGTTK